MTDKAISPLRQRMIEDMTIRKLAPKTQHDYVQRVKHFTAFLGRSPDLETRKVSARLPDTVLIAPKAENYYAFNGKFSAHGARSAIT
jgi:hypothetical protein